MPRIAPAARAWSNSAAGTCPSSTPASPTSTWRCARAPGCSTSATWARSSWPAPTRSTPCSGSRATTRRGSPSARFSTRRSRPPTGTFVDDVLVYRMATDHFLLVVNAGNIMKDHEWIAAQVASARRRRRGRQRQFALRAARPAGAGEPGDSADADRRRPRQPSSTTGSRPARSPSVRATISRTGYTGEDGFEIFVPPAQAERVWDALLAGRARRGTRARAAWARATRCGSRPPCASAAATWTTRRRVLEAGLGWIVGWKKAEFLGADRAARAEGRRRSPASSSPFEMRDRAIARHGHPVVARRPRGRRRHERHADAVSEEGDWLCDGARRA